MMFQTKRVVILLLLLLYTVPKLLFGQGSSQLPFSYVLGNEATTSAGVFTSDGTLVKTLWSGVKYQAGTYTGSWNGVDNEGHMADAGNYTVKIISNNVTYQWEGVVGNTSQASTGPTVYHAAQLVTNMVVVGQYAYCAVGYNEGAASYLKFRLDNPQQKQKIHDSDGHTVRFLAADSSRVYWAGQQDGTTSFIAATTVAGDADVTFAAGQVVKTNHYVYNGIDVTGNQDYITGMAAQKTGDYLFVTHKNSNTIKVFHKTTGTLIRTLSLASPREIALATDTSLWITYDANTVERFVVNANGTLTATGTVLLGLAQALAITTSTDGATVAVVDGGISQQVKTFDAGTGAALWTLGQAGGYATDPTVASDKFYFTNTKIFREDDYGTNHPFLCFQPDGSFWVGDIGNLRAEHFSATQRYLEQLAYIGYFYSCAVDPNNPGRVFANYLEFEVDYTKPLLPGNGSWRLAKNWSMGRQADFDDEYKRLMCVTTLSNGRTYALAQGRTTPSGALQVIELPAAGQIRYTGVFTPNYNYRIFADGSLWSLNACAVGQPAIWKKQVLNGFDGNNNPQWTAEVQVAGTPPLTGKDPVTTDGYLKPNQVTSSGVVVAFCSDRPDRTIPAAARRGDGFHLGGVRVGTNQWLWKASPSTGSNYEGAFPTDGTYDIGNGVEYAGTFAQAVERSIFWGYNGEFWKGGQTNKWQQYYDNGLFIGQFGEVRQSGIEYEEAPAGMAGNALTGTFVKVGSDYYFYHCDENTHAGIHRWKISGLTTIQEQNVATLTLTTQHGLLAQYFTGEDLNNVNLVSTVITPVVRSANRNHSVRWTGFVEPPASQSYSFHVSAGKKVRLWVNDALLINQWSNADWGDFTSAVVAMEAGRKYAVRLESSSDSATLDWSSPDQTRQQIPTGSLYAAMLPDTSAEVRLNEGLLFNTTMESSLYGWTRNPEVDYGQTSPYGNRWLIRTNVRGTTMPLPDVNVLFQPPSDGLTVTVSRNLNDNSINMNRWSVTGSLTYPANDYDKGADKGYLQVVDENNKVIAQIYRREVSYPTDYRLYLNNQTVAQMNREDMQAIGASPQAIALTATSSGITLRYGSYPPVTTTPLNSTSNWRRPQTLRVVFYSQTRNEHELNLSDMRFTGSLANSTTLPVKLLSFGARKASQQVLLSWSTTSEAHTALFIIERSEDGQPFTRIGTVSAEGSTGNHNYSLADRKPLTVMACYRLKMIDTDGTYSYSEVVAVAGATATFELYPNPAQGVLQVSGLGETSGYLRILSVTGKKVMQIPLTPGNTNASLDISLLPQGYYFMQYYNGSSISTKQFLKQ